MFSSSRSRRRNLDRVAELLGLGDDEPPLTLSADGSTGGDPPFATLENGAACADRVLEEGDKEGGEEAEGGGGAREGSDCGGTASSGAAAATPRPLVSLRDDDLVLAAAHGRPRARFVPAAAFASLASNAAELPSSAGSSAGGARMAVAFVCAAGLVEPGSGARCFCARGGTKPVVRVNPLGQVSQITLSLNKLWLYFETRYFF